MSILGFLNTFTATRSDNYALFSGIKGGLNCNCADTGSLWNYNNPFDYNSDYCYEPFYQPNGPVNMIMSAMSMILSLFSDSFGGNYSWDKPYKNYLPLLGSNNYDNNRFMYENSLFRPEKSAYVTGLNSVINDNGRISNNYKSGSGSDYFNAVGKSESGGKYNIKNNEGYIGKYQFGEGALIDAGFKDRSGRWTGKMGVYSESDFLNNPAAQENGMQLYTQKQWNTLKKLGAENYIGRVVNGIPITKSGLLGASHLAGAGGTMKFLKTGYNPNDSNGTTLSNYLRKFAHSDSSLIS